MDGGHFMGTWTKMGPFKVTMDLEWGPFSWAWTQGYIGPWPAKGTCLPQGLEINRRAKCAVISSTLFRNYYKDGKDFIIELIINIVILYLFYLWQVKWLFGIEIKLFYLYVKNFKCHLTTAGNQIMSLNSVELVKDCTGLACQLARSNNEEFYTTTIRIRITQEDDGFFLENYSQT